MLANLGRLERMVLLNMRETTMPRRQRAGTIAWQALLLAFGLGGFVAFIVMIFALTGALQNAGFRVERQSCEDGQ